MRRLPILYGYLGVVPFVIFLLCTLLLGAESRHREFLALLQMAYATMVLSFLGGVHWGLSLPEYREQQIHFAMLPTVAGFFLMLAVSLTGAFLPLVGAAGMFWVVYWADKRWLPQDRIPEGYLAYRKRLTWIVSATLLFSALLSA